FLAYSSRSKPRLWPGPTAATALLAAQPYVSQPQMGEPRKPRATPWGRVDVAPGSPERAIQFHPRCVALAAGMNCGYNFSTQLRGGGRPPWASIAEQEREFPLNLYFAI